MPISWQERSNKDTIFITAHCSADDSTEQAQLAINDTIEKAIEIVPLNISDDSVYMMFEWCAATAMLTVVLTDENKAKDSQRIVQCELPAIVAVERETIRFWIRDYLTTCDGFMRFSLIAIFHTGDRSYVDLL